eukprot:scaffold73094_cov22-Prasinocladus_malaysianus.AAC.1
MHHPRTAWTTALRTLAKWQIRYRCKSERQRRQQPRMPVASAVDIFQLISKARLELGLPAGVPLLDSYPTPYRLLVRFAWHCTSTRTVENVELL